MSKVMEEKKPRTTKQHLIDKLILGKLPLHQRHRRMSQYGGNGERDLKLENAVSGVEFDTTNLTIDKQCELRAKYFLEIVEIYIEQLENVLQKTVAKCVLAKLLAEDGQYIVMSYSPQKLRSEKKEQYGTLENYKSILEENFKQVTLENRVSKMFSAIVERVPKDSNESWTNAELNIYCRVVNDSIYNWHVSSSKNKSNVNDIFVSGIGMTPEEYSELLFIYNKEAKGVLQHGEADIVAQCWIDEIQASYQPDLYFYNGFFRNTISNRIKDAKKREYREIDLVEASKKYYANDTDTSEHDFDNTDESYNRLNHDNFPTDSPDNPLNVVEREQVLSILREWEIQLPPNKNYLIMLKKSDITNEEIADRMNSKFPDTSKSGKVKALNKDSVRYHLKKLEQSLETFLRSKGIIEEEIKQ